MEYLVLVVVFCYAAIVFGNEWSKVFNEMANKNSQASPVLTIRDSLPWQFKSQTKCQHLDSSSLLKRLKDEGDFNPSYMAPDLDEAADKFEDLAKKSIHQLSNKRLTCDSNCDALRRDYVQLLSRANKLPPADQVELMPDLSNRVERISNAGLNFARYKMAQQGWQMPVATGPAALPVSAFNNFFRIKRASESSSFSFADKPADGASVGSENVIYCWTLENVYDAETGLHQMCSACRSIRRLPDNFYPPFINEVFCKGDECLGGQGQCVQQTINLNVLKNIGTKHCENWVRHTIKVSVCCDCMLKSGSALLQQLSENR